MLSLSIYGRGMNAELERHNTATDYQKEFGKTASDINKQSHSNTTYNSLQLVEQYTPHYAILRSYHIYDNNPAQFKRSFENEVSAFHCTYTFLCSF